MAGEGKSGEPGESTPLVSTLDLDQDTNISLARLVGLVYTLKRALFFFFGDSPQF